MNRLTIDLNALYQNIDIINGWMRMYNATWTLVTKVLCGHSDSLKALQLLGIRSIGDSRLINLKAIERIIDNLETWYLRLPHLSAVDDVIQLSDVSLNSEIKIIKALNDKANIHDKLHRVIIMIELGDLREGILPSSLIKFYKEIFELKNIEVIGIGTNLGCMSGVIPNEEQLTQLILYRELLELKFDRKLPLISAGSTVVLPLLLNNRMPKGINHFRIGEAVFLGTDLINGGILTGLRDDVFLLEGEIAELKEKSLTPYSETTDNVSPFGGANSSENDTSPGQRGYRALVTIGELDTDVNGLTPVVQDYSIAGGSSDIIVVNVGDNPDNLKIGDTIKFKLKYSALLRLMSVNYLRKQVIPPISELDKETFNNIDITTPIKKE